jgi:hypothetical protein
VAESHLNFSQTQRSLFVVHADFNILDKHSITFYPNVNIRVYVVYSICLYIYSICRVVKNIQSLFKL